MDKCRIKITEFLQCNDRNGCYTGENFDSENMPNDLMLIFGRVDRFV